MYMSESTNPVHSLSFLLASLRSELTFLWMSGKMRRGKNKAWISTEELVIKKRLNGKDLRGFGSFERNYC